MKNQCKECGASAFIQKTARLHPELAVQYCACSNKQCGHTFVQNITFSHTLTPSAKTTDIWLKAAVKGMNPQQRKTLMEFLQQSAA